MRRGGSCTAPATAFVGYRSVRAPAHTVWSWRCQPGSQGRDEDKAGIAVRAALDTAVPRLQEEVGRDIRLLVALPAFRIGMGGDRDHRLRSGGTRSRRPSTRCSGMPASISPSSPTPRPSIISSSRRTARLIGEPKPDPAYPLELERAVADSGCGLYGVGHGLSRGAGLPDWGQLVEGMALELGIASRNQLDNLDLAQWYRERFSPGRAGGGRPQDVRRPGSRRATDSGPLPADVPPGPTRHHDELRRPARTGPDCAEATPGEGDPPGGRRADAVERRGPRGEAARRRVRGRGDRPVPR